MAINNIPLWQASDMFDMAGFNNKIGIENANFGELEAQIGGISSVYNVINTGWKKLQSYETAGSYTWTAPDLFDGKNYLIGVMVIGGGGSGACQASVRGGGDEWAKTYGGASGRSLYFEMLVTPGQSIPGVVGAGGARISLTATTGQNPGSNGTNGGSSSFMGLSAEGGGGGPLSNRDSGTLSVSGAFGGQNSGGLIFGEGKGCPGQYGGTMVLPPHASGFSIELLKKIKTLDCFNPFENKKILGAGSSCQNVDAQDNSTVLSARDPATGEHGGDAVGSYQNGNAIAGDGVGSGNGGGGACAYDSTGPITAISGAGADGAIYIYIQGVNQ